jgi:hypothetical protein
VTSCVGRDPEMGRSPVLLKCLYGFTVSKMNSELEQAIGSKVVHRMAIINQLSSLIFTRVMMSAKSRVTRPCVGEGFAN